MPLGRPPVPAEVRAQRGEKDRALPVVIGGRVAPEMPPFMDAEMKRCWNTIVDDLVSADVIDHADAGVIESAAIFWARARAARRDMRGQPLLILTPQGQVPNRLLDIERNSWQHFRALAESLPISPWGRARLGLKSKGAVGKDSTDDIGLPPRLRAVANDE